MKLNNLILSIIVLVIVIGGIGISVAFNLWDNKPGNDLPFSEGYNPPDSPNSENTTAGVNPALNLNTPYKPADIKGTNTFAEISQMFYIPLKDMGNAFGLTTIPNYKDLKARELKAIYTDLGSNIKMETESVRIFVSMYVNKPYTYSDTAYLPAPAVKILKEKVTLSKEQLAFLDGHTIDISRFQLTNIPGTAQSNKPVVTGETSFQRLLDWGVSRDEIEKVIGEKLPATNILIRDYAMQKGKDFLAVVAALQETVNRLYSSR